MNSTAAHLQRRARHLPSFFLFWLFGFAIQGSTPVNSMLGLKTLGWFALCFFLGLLPAMYKPESTRPVWRVAAEMSWALAVALLLLVPITIVLVGLYPMWGPRSTVGGLLYFATSLSLSYASDIVYVAVTRWMLRQAAGSERAYKIVGMILIDVILAIVFVAAPTLLAVVELLSFHSEFIFAVLLFGFVWNSIDLVACSAFLVVAILLLMHRLLWPLLERPVYAFARFGVIKRKKLLFTLGVLLLPPMTPPIAALLELLPKIGG